MNTQDFQDFPKVGDRVTSEYIKNAAIQRAVVTEEHATWYKVFLLFENGKSFDAIFKKTELRKLGGLQ